MIQIEAGQSIIGLLLRENSVSVKTPYRARPSWVRRWCVSDSSCSSSCGHSGGLRSTSLGYSAPLCPQMDSPRHRARHRSLQEGDRWNNYRSKFPTLPAVPCNQFLRGSGRSAICAGGLCLGGSDGHTQGFMLWPTGTILTPAIKERRIRERTLPG